LAIKSEKTKGLLLRHLAQFQLSKDQRLNLCKKSQGLIWRRLPAWELTNNFAAGQPAQAQGQKAA
jgi:hypothetical protein